MVVMIEDKNEFDGIIKENALVVVDFTATWCGPCKMIGPKFEAMESEFPAVKFIKVDVDEAEEIAASVGVSAMPTFKMYKNGKIVDELVGASEAKLRAMLEKYGNQGEQTKS